MTSQAENRATVLSKTLYHNTKDYNYTIKWCDIGNPSSPPLIFVHGTPWSSRVWVPFALALSSHYHVYLYDRPGFGDSPPEQKNQKHQQATSDVEEFDGDLARQSAVFSFLYKSWEPEWHGRKPHVIAHDNAGLITLRTTLQFGCEYASLCLIDVVAIGPWGQPLFKSIAENPTIFTQLPRAAFEGILESYIREAAFHELPKATMEMLKAPWLEDGGREGFIREICQANCRRSEDIEGRYGEVGSKIPVKVIWGVNDDWLPLEMAHRLAKAVNAKETVTIQEAGHLILYDQRAQLGVEIGHWLASVSADSG